MREFLRSQSSSLLSATNVTTTKTMATSAASTNPIPTASPMQAQAHRPAAVVRPRTSLRRVTMIVPTPRKPTPETTCEPMRLTSALNSG